MARDRNNFLLDKRLIITSIIAALLIVIANSAVWVNRQIFDTNNFTNTAVTSITSESSRKAIGARITDEALQNRPVAKNIVGDQITNVLSGLLGTDQANKLLTITISKLQVYVTSKNQQDVAIDLTGLKSTLTTLVEAIGNEQSSRIDPQNIPDKIVLVQAKNVPDLYQYGVVLSWLAPFALIIALGLLAWPYIKDRLNYLTIMTVQGAALILAGLLSLLLGPLFRPMVLEPIQNPNGRVVVENLYNAFIATFDNQTMVLIYLGLALILISFAIRLYPQLKKMKAPAH